MKKWVTLAVVFLILSSCNTEKKKYYIFNNPVHRYNTLGDQKKPDSSAQKVPPVLLAEEEKPKQPAFLQASDSGGVASVARAKDSEIAEAVIKDNNLEDIGENESASILLPDIPAQTQQPPKNGNLLLLLASGILGLAALGLTKVHRPTATKLTRWAKANPGRTQGLMASMQLPLLGLGAMAGYNFYQLGYEISEPAIWGFTAAAGAGFLATPFLPKRNHFVLPQTVNRRRLVYLGIIVSSLMTSVGFGNQVDKNFPDTTISRAVASLDQKILALHGVDVAAPVSQKETSVSEQTNQKKAVTNKVQKARKANAGISMGVAILLTALLAILTCAGICLAIGGLLAISNGQIPGGLLLLIGGTGITYLTIRGIGKIWRLHNEREDRP